MAERVPSASPPVETFVVVDESEAANMSSLPSAAAVAESPNNTAQTASSPSITDEPAPVFYQGPHITNKPPVATRACLSCRKLKMKCVGSANPPCERCAKTSRDCEFLQPGQSHPPQPRRRKPQQTPVTFDGLIMGNGNGERTAYSGPSWTPITPDAAASNGTKKRSPLPGSSVGNGSTPVVAQQPSVKRRRTGGRVSEAPELLEETLPVGDMEQLLELFQERLLRFIPILGPEDFSDIQTMLRERPALVHCVCYVTARFLPGGSVIREKLHRSVIELLLDTSSTQGTSPMQYLALIQALIVLYAYAPAVPANDVSCPPARELLYWYIKAFAEAQALRLGLSKSIDGLRDTVAANEPQILTSYYYKMYTYWLWIYTMSQYGSQATRTPPSIRADASIRAASGILRSMAMETRVANLLEEVELCLVWEQTNTAEEWGEWWCPPEPMERRAGPKEVLDRVQLTKKILDRSQNPYTSTNTGSQGSNRDFHLRITRFCISTNALRQIKLAPNPREGLEPAEAEAVEKVIEAASQVLTWALDLGPVNKDRLRYLGDFGYVMISFCAFFILQAFRRFGDAVPYSEQEYLNTVEDAALLMTELAMDSKHAPAVYGKSILQLLDSVRATVPSSIHGSDVSWRAVVTKASSESGMQASVAHESPVFVSDEARDFTSLFPDLL